MNPYLMSLPTVLAGALIVFYALREVRRIRIADTIHKAEYEQKMADFERRRMEREAALMEAGQPVELQITLELVDQNSLVDIAQMARDTEWLVAGVSKYETSIGGDGLILTFAQAKRGQVLLTLTPKNATGSAERVKRVADALNAAFASSIPPTGEVVLDIGRLPSIATAVHAITVA
jgi:hypothetical protein